ncbi:MAG TPA: hypothetical protein VN577_23415 [Terriglobales bacterium]|nr:hypothetical protein [Terriglobales bacterium]
MKNLLRATVLTLVTAGILSAAVAPKNVQPVSPNASPIPWCDPGTPHCQLIP